MLASTRDPSLGGSIVHRVKKRVPFAVWRVDASGIIHEYYNSREIKGLEIDTVYAICEVCEMKNANEYGYE